MKTLKISSELSLPLDAVTQTFGILAVRGAGKSNAAVVMAEQMFAASLPFVVVDPKGDWWGIRSSKDGSGPGLAIPIFGGRHGDVPLERGSGILIADLIVDQRLSCVLDVSEFTEGEKIRFLIDFADRLFRRNEDPLHLFLEEADDYIPQKPFREQARLVHTFEKLVKQGRARGLGATLISQRSAVVNKNVLTQVETLIALRTTSPQDRKAIEAWIEYHAQRADILESLSKLENGEAWIWSPQWLKLVKRIRFDRRATFDSGATPKMAKSKRAPATLADVDLQAIAASMAETIERAKAEDPKELRAQIRHLENEIRALQAKASNTIEIPVEVPFLDDASQTLLKTIRESVDRLVDDAEAMRSGLTSVLDLLLERAEQAEAKFARPPATAERTPPRTSAPPQTARARGVSSENARTSSRTTERSDTDLSTYARGLVETVARRHPMGLTRAQISTLSGRKPRSSAFQGAMAELAKTGWLVNEDGLYRVAPDRVEEIREQLPAESGNVIERWMRALPTYERSLLEQLVLSYPRPMLRTELAEASGRSLTSSAFQGAISTLIKNALVTSTNEGLCARHELFEGAA